MFLFPSLGYYFQINPNNKFHISIKFIILFLLDLMKPVYCGIIGDEGVGKTSALLAYASNTFPEGPLPSTFEDYSCNVLVEDHPYLLTLHDTAESDPICDVTVDVFLLIYSITSKSSFDNIQNKWKPWLSKHYPNTKIVLAGNKIDERDSIENSTSLSNGKRLAKVIGAQCYVEFSVKSQEGLRDAFEKVILAFLSNSTKSKPKDSRLDTLNYKKKKIKKKKK